MSHLRSLQSASDNAINPPISMMARPVPKDERNDDNASILLTRSELRALINLVKEDDREDKKHPHLDMRGSPCYGCEKTFTGSATFGEHRLKK